MMLPALTDLHAPYASQLQQVLERCTPTGARVALDIACGPGLKWGWLANHVAPDGLLVGLDCDRAALLATPRTMHHYALAGDAHALPFQHASADLVWCVAALRLFADPRAALTELQRVLKPAGTLVIVVAEQLWVRPRLWSPALVAAWAAAGSPFVPPADGLGAELLALTANFPQRALLALLPLAPPAYHPWLALADPVALGRLLDGATLQTANEADIEPEVATVVFVMTATPAPAAIG